MSSERLVVAIAPALFVVLWSTGFVGARYGLPYAEPLTFLSMRIGLVVAVLALLALVGGARWPSARETRHSIVTGVLMHGLYLCGVFVAIAQGVPVGISALIPGLQPILTSTLANRFLGEPVSARQWFGLALGLVGVLMVLHDRAILGSGTPLGWAASVMSLVGVTLGTLHQKRFGSGIDWRTGNLVQYAAVAALFVAGAFCLETREVRWSGELVFALAWLVLMLSVGAVGLMYWLIRRSPATGFASLFYLVPAVTALMAFVLFDERLDAISAAGMVVCAAGVFIVNRGGIVRRG